MPSAKTPKARVSYVCSECGWTSPKWLGQCRECKAWGTLEEFHEAAGGGAVVSGGQLARAAAVRPAVPARPIGDVSAEEARARPTGVGELDRVLGGGIVPGAVVLLAGEPGVGKSTLLLDVAAKAAAVSRARGEGPVLYVTGEESASQVRLRAERIDAIDPALLLASETELGALLGHVEAAGPSLLVVDSVQTIASSEVDGSPGNVGQVREVAAALIQSAKSTDTAMLLVGHVTKEGSIAGPRVLEHLVDVVVQFEGDRHSRLRLVRAVKNRYGPTDEVGCFDLSDAGITGLADPSGLFLSQRTTQVPGTCVTITLEGRRPLVTEVQALVAPSQIPTPRRATSGLDAARVSMITAVLDRRAGAPLGKHDIYLSTVGGVRVTEPASDLAVALALASSLRDQPLPAGTVALGEVGLAGEVRPATGVARRIAEAARLGFTRALVPPGVRGSEPVPPGLTVVEVPDVAERADDAIARMAQWVRPKLGLA